MLMCEMLTMETKCSELNAEYKFRIWSHKLVGHTSRLERHCGARQLRTARMIFLICCLLTATSNQL